MALPPGTASANTVTLGHSQPTPSAASQGLLHLEGTVFTVNTEIVVHETGLVETTVAGASAGLDLLSGTVLTIDEGGVINLTFAVPAPGHTGIYSGLRAEGDRLDELEALNVAGKLTWDDTLFQIETGDTVTIFTDDTHTYVGVNTVPTVTLPGDVNGDCVVNILDLIGIRNHLNEDPTSPPENAAYDVNDDGSINILDMIFVRNRLNTSCPEE